VPTERSTLTRRPAAVIFDLDDTLVVSTVDYGKFKRLVIDRIAEDGEHRSDYSPDELILKILNRYQSALRARGLTDPEIKEKLAALDRIMDAVELERVCETVAIPGAPDVLSMLRARGVKVGILTRGCHEYAAAALDRTGMGGLVDGIEGRNSKTKPKPDPESYLKLARALGVDRDDLRWRPPNGRRVRGQCRRTVRGRDDGGCPGRGAPEGWEHRCLQGRRTDARLAGGLPRRLNPKMKQPSVLIRLLNQK